jgi:hypothetical protein
MESNSLSLTVEFSEVSHFRYSGTFLCTLYMYQLVMYSGYTLRSEIEAPLITREVLPETYFLLVNMAADAQAGPFLQFQASCSCGTL